MRPRVEVVVPGGMEELSSQVEPGCEGYPADDDQATTKRFQSVRTMLNTLFPGNPQGHLACRLNTRIAMIMELWAAEVSVFLQSPPIFLEGGEGTRGAKVESLVKRFERRLLNLIMLPAMYSRCQFFRMPERPETGQMQHSKGNLRASQNIVNQFR